jgi:c-di-GMP-binding flagellar brake protein YcgR
MNSYPLEANRRVHERKLLRVAAQVIVPGRPEVEVRTWDISAGGIAVVAAVNPPVGLKFKLRVRLPVRPAGTAALESQVEVMHSVLIKSEGGFKVGLRFVDLSSTAAAAVMQFLTG